MEKVIEVIMREYEISLFKAQRLFSGKDLTDIMDANRQLYVLKIENTFRREIIGLLEKGE